ncbi:methionine/alanine import NSS transporter subunit MetS [Corynebacterium kroppenstedtii]|uniref:methionine/alanine import NSS transporter subunit MetS n=1 Tax=Corynebacterium sp. PCR 32 TaxID=3351342 RepID=UPI00309AA970
MSGTAVMMMTLFMLVIWGGLAASTYSLMKNPDETSGRLGDDPNATDEKLYDQGY